MDGRLQWARGVRIGSALVALGVATGFAALILGRPAPGVLLHEVAGAALLGFIGLSLCAATRLRATEPRPFRRILGALFALFGVGTAGALLAIGTLPATLSYLPVVGLVVLGILLVDSIRVSRPPPRGPPTRPPSERVPTSRS